MRVGDETGAKRYNTTPGGTCDAEQGHGGSSVRRARLARRPGAVGGAGASPAADGAAGRHYSHSRARLHAGRRPTDTRRAARRLARPLTRPLAARREPTGRGTCLRRAADHALRHPGTSFIGTRTHTSRDTAPLRRQTATLLHRYARYCR